MKNQVDNKVIIAAIAGVLLIVVLIGYFTLGNRHSSGPPSPEMQKLNTDPVSQGKGSEPGGK